ncbi:hypothetical protein [Janthinobacterium sp. PSPC3-1]|uniref:hypothetical protein n=1 Tax=Janthinobacterium sp. PSPC3-1 TaxID=2804653 RepID=UPI003CEC1989
MPTSNHTSALTATPPRHAAHKAPAGTKPTVATRVLYEEFDLIRKLHADGDNYGPKFSCTDLISACISLTFTQQQPELLIFTYLHTELLLRDQRTPRRQEEIWKPQYEQLLVLQRSPENCHPNPHFTLDHFTTACIAIIIKKGIPKYAVFGQARANTAARSAGGALLA